MIRLPARGWWRRRPTSGPDSRRGRTGTARGRWPAHGCLIGAVGAGSATVAGHDWGGGLAWLLAVHHPERVQRLVVLNAPHPIRFLTGLHSPRQLRRSWYILAFQAPWLPERLVAARDFGRCVGPWVASRPGRAPSPPRTSTAMWPRPPSPVPCGPPSTTTGPPSGPTPGPGPRLASGGRPDPGHLGRPGPLPGSGAGRAGPGLGPGGAGRADPQASHWVQADAPERVNQLMVDFLQPIGG
jgi:epoxide hydrolase 4